MAKPKTPDKPLNKGRNGLFEKGGKPGPGRPPKAREEKALEAFRKGCTFADITAIVRAQVIKAKAGDLAAAKFVCEGLIGRLPEYVPPPPVMSNTKKEPIRYTVDQKALAVVEARNAND